MARKTFYILPNKRKANDYDRLHPLIAMKLERKRREMKFVAETDKGEKVVGRFRNAN